MFSHKYFSKGDEIMKFLGNIFSFLGNITASAASTGCVFLVFDEPKMPKSLIK